MSRFTSSTATRMKRSLFTLLMLNLCVTAVLAQAEIVKQRAKGVANVNNPPAGNSSAAPVTSAPRPAPTATPPNVQQQRVTKLKADLAGIHQAGKVSPEAKQEFTKDLLALAQGATRPSASSLSALADSLLPAIADQKVSRAIDDRLVQKLVVLINSRGLSSTRTQEIADEAQTALTSAGVSAEDAAKISSALQAIATDVQQAANH